MNIFGVEYNLVLICEFRERYQCNAFSFPPLVVHMVDVGERSGELETMLAKVADTYDEQVENSVSRLTALLEPMLILIMVGLVLGIILATLVPLLEITSAIQ